MDATPHNQDPLERVSALTMAKLHTELTPEEAVELSSLLEASPEAREAYWEIVSLHGQLQWDLEGLSESSSRIAEDVLGLAAPAGGALGAGGPSTRSLWSLAIAAGLLMAVVGGGISVWRLAGDSAPLVAEADPEGSPIVGALTSLTPDSVWSFGRPGADNSDQFLAGDTIRLETGAAELRLTNDTVALLESPLVMQVVSIDRVRLLQGGIKVEVPKGAEGFSVETATAEVIDLGTVFSVGVVGGATDVVVFDGEVDLKVTSNGHADTDPQESVKRFRAGQAVQVAADGTLSRIVNVRQTALASDGDGAAPVVSSVSDNYVRDDFWSFYEIVPGGMAEDAKAFVDRPHEWNGDQPQGMPAYLVGGDYIKTFNDDKVTEDLAINLTFDRPATLYVLLDKRVSPPEWLLESFEETGDEIGVDEAPYFPDREIPDAEKQIAVGPARSVNRNHSIWKKTIAEPGVVTLGANGELIDETPEGVLSRANMYGVVATPLEESP